MAKTILIASGKGGTGKTSLTAHLGYELSMQNYKVLLIDADCGFKGLDLLLSVSDKAIFNFLDIFKNNATFDEAKVKINDNLFLLSAPLYTDDSSYNISHVAKFIDSIFTQFDYILIDCAAGFTYDTRIFSKIAHAGLIVTTPDILSLRGCENIGILFEKYGISTNFLVVNRLRKKLILQNKAFNIDDVIDKTAIPLLGIIPEDECIISSSNIGELVFNNSKSQAKTAYKNIANRLLGKKVDIMKIK